MIQTVKAVYQNGAFVPVEPSQFPENTEVELTVHHRSIYPPPITESSEKTKVLRDLVARMKNNPLQVNAPKLKRDELHDCG